VKAIIMAGSPCAGKSTYLSKTDTAGYVVYSIDDIMEDLSLAEGFTLDQKNATADGRSKFAKAMIRATKQLKEDILPQAIKRGESFILDGTASSVVQTSNLTEKLELHGYTVRMVFIRAPLKTVLERNQTRLRRSIVPSLLERLWYICEDNIPCYRILFGDDFSIRAGS